MGEDPMKVDKVIELINAALPLQFRSAYLYTWVAGSATGVEPQVIAQKLEEFGRAELDDARRLIEKLTALGGGASTGVAEFEPIPPTRDGIRKLIDLENEALRALHKVIPETGQEPRSEALEHLIEHILMRKQEQVDFLQRVLEQGSQTTAGQEG